MVVVVVGGGGWERHSSSDNQPSMAVDHECLTRARTRVRVCADEVSCSRRVRRRTAAVGGEPTIYKEGCLSDAHCEGKLSCPVAHAMRRQDKRVVLQVPLLGRLEAAPAARAGGGEGYDTVTTRLRGMRAREQRQTNQRRTSSLACALRYRGSPCG